MLWSDLERIGHFFDPFRDFERAGMAFGFEGPSAVEFPAMNVWASDGNAVITTELPGMDPEAIDISVANGSLTLSGLRKAEELKEGESYHRKERWDGRFKKTIELPFSVDASKVQARFSKGVLYISLPRAEADKPRKISIKSE